MAKNIVGPRNNVEICGRLVGLPAHIKKCIKLEDVENREKGRAYRTNHGCEMPTVT